ncbi:MAG: SpoIVB peptidase [Bacillota bacterium]
MPCLSFRKIVFIFFAMLTLCGCFSQSGRGVFTLPTQHQVISGESLTSSLNIPQSIRNNIVFRTDHPEFLSTDAEGRPIVRGTGKFEASMRLFDLIPLRYMTVTALPQVKVIPGGQAIGILVHAQGVMIVGQAPVVDEEGDERMPAKEAGIKVGDVILKINGHQVISESDVRSLVDEAGQKGQLLEMELKRRDRVYKTSLKPVRCSETGRYRIGLLVRDRTAGVGTLTFYDPLTKSYGALGHVIADAQTAQAIQLANGKIVEAFIQDIRPGRRGQPGEKIGTFVPDSGISGTINKNSAFGIFGLLLDPPETGIYRQAIPIALVNQVKCGPAQMLTVIDGRKVESFDIEIERIRHEGRRDGRGLLIRITDQRLLERSGGIVQGMSGSPIIQNGRFVGAVTHVFINNPTRGYGVPAEWMLDECGLLEAPSDEQDRNAA